MTLGGNSWGRPGTARCPQLVASQAVAARIAMSDGALGSGNAVWSEYFRGRIDEVRIYNRPLSAAEIQQDMTPPL